MQAGQIIELLLRVEKTYATSFVERPLQSDQKVVHRDDDQVQPISQVPDTQEL